MPSDPRFSLTPRCSDTKITSLSGPTLSVDKAGGTLLAQFFGKEGTTGAVLRAYENDKTQKQNKVQKYNHDQM